MIYKDFVLKAIQQDVRNVFSESDNIPKIVPQSLRAFYEKHNPIDVEINTEKYGAIRFYGVDELEQLGEEYYFYPKDIFVFATCNGEPFFIDKDNCVYTS